MHRVSTRFLGTEDTQGALHHRRCRFGRGRQVDHLAHPAGAAAALAHLAQGRSRHHRRLPASPMPSSTERGTDAKEGLSRKLRSRRAARRSCPTSNRARPTSRCRSIRTSSTTSLPGEFITDRPARHPDRRGAEHPAAGRAAEVRQADPLRLGLSSISRSISTPTKPICATGSWSASAGLRRDRLHRPQELLSPLRRNDAPTRPRRSASGPGTTINLPNLRDNILPTRSRADLILKKGRQSRHRGSVALRRV